LIEFFASEVLSTKDHDALKISYSLFSLKCLQNIFLERKKYITKWHEFRIHVGCMQMWALMVAPVSIALRILCCWLGLRKLLHLQSPSTCSTLSHRSFVYCQACGTYSESSSYLHFPSHEEMLVISAKSTKEEKQITWDCIEGKYIHDEGSRKASPRIPRNRSLRR
jgi:hypothetical protein